MTVDSPFTNKEEDENADKNEETKEPTQKLLKEMTKSFTPLSMRAENPLARWPLGALYISGLIFEESSGSDSEFLATPAGEKRKKVDALKNHVNADH